MIEVALRLVHLLLLATEAETVVHHHHVHPLLLATEAATGALRLQRALLHQTDQGQAVSHHRIMEEIVHHQTMVVAVGRWAVAVVAGLEVVAEAEEGAKLSNHLKCRTSYTFCYLQDSFLKIMAPRK